MNAAGPPPPAAGHRLPVRIYFEDTDFSGVVYHGSYVRFLERGRSEFLRALGVSHRDLAAEGLAFAVRRLDMTFHRPARIDDLVEIVTRVVAVEGARLQVAQEVWLDGIRLVEAGVDIVVINAAGRPRRLPAALRHRFVSAAAADAR